MTPPPRPPHSQPPPSRRPVEDEGILRLFLLAFALILPLAAMAYLKTQHTRLSYQMSDLREQIREEQENQRALMLERSRLQRVEEVQAYADRSGMQLPKRSQPMP